MHSSKDCTTPTMRVAQAAGNYKLKQVEHRQAPSIRCPAARAKGRGRWHALNLGWTELSLSVLGTRRA
jgi:hypothetical protein